MAKLLDQNEHLALSRLLLGRPRTVRQALAAATLFAGQAVVCAVLLLWGYGYFKKPAGNWAIMSACLALQPGLVQSIGASLVRIAANVVGAIIGLAVGSLLGVGGWQLIVALVAVVFACQLLRLDLALRSACVTVIIILTFNHGNVLLTGLERSSAVIIGCSLAVIVQMVIEGLREWFGWTEKPLTPPAKPQPAAPAK